MGPGRSGYRISWIGINGSWRQTDKATQTGPTSIALASHHNYATLVDPGDDRNGDFMKDHQMSFDQFDPTLPPRCANRIDLNGFVKNCFFCPFAVRNKETISCRLKGKKITTGEKYALSAWKELRDRVLSRDGHACTICSCKKNLHIHHIDADNTHDDPENLVTLCQYCHARAHSEMKKTGGVLRVMKVISYCRKEGSEKKEPGNRLIAFIAAHDEPSDQP
jgi:5-methylcytosine-specific restriction endonuclease McrA